MKGTLDRQAIEGIVLNAIRMTNQAREAEQQLRVASDASLFGGDSRLDSLGLVSLLMDIEDLLRGEGYELTLSDERAMSQSRSPFRDVQSLVDFIEQLIAEAVGKERDDSAP